MEKNRVLIKKLKEVKGFEKFENYEIYSDGRLYNIKKDEFLKGHESQYLFYTICSNGECKTTSAHRLVALAFVNGYFEGAEVDHIVPYRESKDNNYTNLRWVTLKENRKRIKHTSKKTKRYVIAQKIGEKENPKLFLSINQAGKKLNISTSSIYKCLTGIRHSAGNHKFYFVEK